jgi:Holliday junction resolvasome RuvABC DNA-binding subunit
MFVDIHHVVPRSEGGCNDPDNIITMCGAHHRTAHRGELVIEPSRDGSPRFRHADGSPYGHAVTPRIVDAQAKVFAGLRHLGFRERDVRAVLAELLADDELRDATAERLLREALCRIRPTR